MNSTKRTAIVTGGSRGIGAAACPPPGPEGWRVGVGCLRNLPKARELCAQLEAEGCEAFPFQGNVASAAEMEAFAQAVLHRWGQIDLW